MPVPYYQISSNAPPGCYWSVFNRSDREIVLDSENNMFVNKYSQPMEYLSCQQKQAYLRCQSTFIHIYSFNSNAYYKSLTTSPYVAPRYHIYDGYKEKKRYDTGLALVRQVYPEYFSYMPDVPMRYGNIPFPV
jgi:hypothetical protein